MQVLCNISAVAIYARGEKYLIYVTFKEEATGRVISGRLEDSTFPLDLLERLVLCTLGEHLGDFARREFNGTVTSVPRYELLEVTKFTVPQYADNKSGENWAE